MKLLFKTAIIICLFLSSQTKAQQDFSEILLPESRESDTFVDVLNNDEAFVTNTLDLNKNEDENIYSELIPHHKIFFGQVSVYEDKTSFSTIQDSDDFGVKIKGGNGLINYSTGIYNIKKTGGWASVNPLYTVPEAGRLDIGGGIFTNTLGVEDDSEQENTLNFFTGYKFKRFSTKGEFIRKDYTYEDEYLDSWQLSNKFALTKNLNLKAGYKEFEQTNSMVNDFGIEYSLGNIKLELDTSIIRYQDNSDMDSQRFGVKTKYSF